MAMQMDSDRAICVKCGAEYSRRRGYFPVSYAAMYKGLGYIPVCGKCIDSLYNSYLSECNNAKDAVRQVCRKLDLYWNSNLYDAAEKKATTRSVMLQYIMRINGSTYAGKSYDDTLALEGTLWSFRRGGISEADSDADEATVLQEDSIEITPEIKAFWGPGYSLDMYSMLEQRRQYWLGRLPDDVEIDIGMEAIIRQICSLELDINRDRVAGKPVDKNITALNNLLGSANFKPNQKKQDAADASLSNTPLGVWLYKYENKRPLPEIDDELKDTNHILKYVFTWLGHVFKMLGKKHGFTRLYEAEIDRLRIEKPEFADEDDEDFLVDALGGAEDEEDIMGGVGT